MNLLIANNSWISHLSNLLCYDPTQPILFNSGLFLWLFAGFILIYYLLRKQLPMRLLFVTAFSYYFYYKSSGFFFFLLAIVTISDFLIAKKMAQISDKTKRKLLVTFSLIINLGMLGYFKYTNFLGHLVADLINNPFHDLNIFLPVGISFFTFQSLSYTIDVYREDIKPLSNLLDYAFYVSFFPQLVAGPIVRARDFIPQIRQPLMVTKVMLGQGLFFILCGAIKKVIISDYISVNFVERIFENPTLYSGLENLLGVYGYALQIYCDFSGYSDMAIGLALLLGFRFPINFNSPYRSLDITDFWRRWHISLSSWLRDYLYISLGGNRKGKFRQYLNLIITMFLGGLWHGASLNFVFWGLLHGIALAIHKVWMKLMGIKKGTVLPAWRRVLGIVITFHFVCFCWIFFRNTSFQNSHDMIAQITTAFHPELLSQVITGYWRVLAMMLLGYLIHFIPRPWKDTAATQLTNMPLIAKAVVMLVVIWVIIQMRSTDIQPFIYFQF